MSGSECFAVAFHVLLCHVPSMLKKVFTAQAMLLLLLLTTSGGAHAMRIGVVAPDSQDLFWLTYLSFIERGAEQLDIRLEERDAKGERLGLLGHAQGLIDIGVDGLIFSPCCGVGPEVVRRANQAGVPVVATVEPLQGVTPGELPYYLAWVGGDYRKAAYDAARILAGAAEKTSQGVVQLMAVEPAPEAPGREARLQGLAEAVEAMEDVELVAQLPPALLLQRLPQLLEVFPHVGAVWAGDAPAAETAQTALRDAGLTPGTDVLVSAMDLLPENVYGLRTGGLAVDIGGQWMAGGWALLLLYDYLVTGEIAPGQSEPFGLLTVTSKTVSSYENFYPQGLPSFDFMEHSLQHRSGTPVVRDLQREYER